MNTKTNKTSVLTSLACALLLGTLPSLAEPTATEAICPVCRVHDGETETEPVVASETHAGGTYGFCSLDCRDKFLKAPATYVTPVFPRPAPAFVAQDLDGAEFSSEELAGRVVLLDFWATWCPPCVADLPELSNLHARYKEAGVSIVSLSIDEGDDAARKVARMIKKRKATHPVILDSADQPAWAAYSVGAVPAQFLIDATGNIVAQWTGKTDLKQVEAEIVRLVESGDG